MIARSNYPGEKVGGGHDCANQNKDGHDGPRVSQQLASGRAIICFALQCGCSYVWGLLKANFQREGGDPPMLYIGKDPLSKNRGYDLSTRIRFMSYRCVRRACCS